MQTICDTLRAAGFSKKFCDALPHGEDYGHVALLEDANLLRFIQNDFLKNAEEVRSISYTNIVPAALDLGEINASIVTMNDLRTITLGPGVHKYREKLLYLCYESCDIERSIAGTTKFIARVALYEIRGSMEGVKKYVDTVKMKHHITDDLKLFVAHEAGWNRRTTRKRRVKSLHIGKLWPEIYNDANDFLSDETQEWFNDHDIPYKRTYVFNGPPGAGKSSTIKVLASELNLPLYSLNLGYAQMDDDLLIELMNMIPKNSVIAIEDFDRIFDTHTVNVSGSKVTYATLLNILDGALTKEGVIIVMTCNNFDQVDDAIKRPGRIDKIVKFPNVTEATAASMYNSFYPNQEKDARNFAKAVSKISPPVSLSTCQEIFISNRKRKSSEVVAILEDEIHRIKKYRMTKQNGMF